MTEYVFNDKLHAEDIIRDKCVNLSNIYDVISKLARYNFFILSLSDAENYDNINTFLINNCDGYSEICEYKTIERCVSRAKKYSWKNIDKVVITKSELNKISQLHDDRKEKIAFVLLADTKYYKAIGARDYDISFLSEFMIYSMARVTVPKSDRCMFLSFLYDEDLAVRNTNPKFKGKILTYVDDSCDDIGLELDDIDYKELAFAYMNYKYGGYKRCSNCGRLIKNSRGVQYCRFCKPQYISIGIKTIICEDCGREFEVDARNMTKIRCDKCQNVERKRQKREWWNRNKSALAKN